MLLLAVSVSNAQISRKNAAYQYLQQGNLDSAKYNIELAIQDPTTANDAEVWYIRGFVFKSIYNKIEKSDKQSPSRLVALTSFKKSLEIDSSEENKQENIKNIKYLAATIHSDVAECLDSVQYPVAISNFAIFRQYYPFVDPSPANMKQKDIEFYLAIASLYNKIYESDRKGKLEFFQKEKDAYNNVLSLDPNNISANYSMGILFYNQAVNLINQSEYDLDIVALSDVQDNSINLFKESLPFMEKAYSLDPKRKETLLGLSGIYFSLNEFEKSNLFKQKLEEIENQK